MIPRAKRPKNSEFLYLINKGEAVTGLENVPDNIALDDYSAEIEAMLEKMFDDPGESYAIDREHCRWTVMDGKPVVYIRTMRYDTEGNLLSYPAFVLIPED